MALKELRDAGLAPIPINPKTKRPSVAWAAYQQNPPTQSDIESWGNPAWVGTICGPSAGGLEAIDFDVPGKSFLAEGEMVDAPGFNPWIEFLTEHGHADLLARLVIQQTPSGGRHVLYRCSVIAGNRKLAETSDGDCLIETRGKGGLIVCAPSPGYAWLQGDATTIPTITPKERDLLLRSAQLLDESEPEPDRAETEARARYNGALRPGDDYNDRAAWEDMLEPAGWRRYGKWRGQILWVRPGKNPKDGWSAKTGDSGRGDYFYCWSTSTTIPHERGLSKFALLTYLEYKGDFSAAAKALAKQGYGRTAARPAEADPDLSLPVIECNNRSLLDIADEAYAALLGHDNLFVRAGQLVELVEDENGLVKLRGHDEASLRNSLAATAIYEKSSSKGSVRIFPPKDVVQAILKRTDYREARPIRTIVKAPVLSPDGTVRTAYGYDPGSRVFIAGREPWHVAACSVAESVEWIRREVLGDFPFASGADAAHALALIILPFVRHLIDGPTPLHLIDAPTQGTGKSLLARVCLLPAAGGAISATAGTRDEEEWRKKLASSLLEGRPYVFLDNLSRKVDSDALAAVLLATEWNDRSLGKLGNVNLPVSCVWVATANNAELSRDITRRTLWIRLDALVERPEDRTGFQHPDIESWIRRNRVEVASHILRMLTAWTEAGSPKWSGPGMGGYEVWAGVMGGILDACGVPGWLGNLEKLREHADADTVAWGAFYNRWWTLQGGATVIAKDVYDAFCEDDSLVALLGDRSDHGKKITFGKLIAKRVGVVANGYRILREVGRGHATGFRLVETLTKNDQHSPHTHQENQIQTVSVSECLSSFPNLLHVKNDDEAHISYRGSGESDSLKLTHSPNSGDDLIDPYADEPDEEPDGEEAPYRWE